MNNHIKKVLTDNGFVINCEAQTITKEIWRRKQKYRTSTKLQRFLQYYNLTNKQNRRLRPQQQVSYSKRGENLCLRQI